MAEIEIREIKKANLIGGTVIDGFPSAGLVSSIVSTYLIEALELDQIAALDSELFPPISMVYAAKPKFPARIYASEQRKLAVFLAEFTPFPYADRSIAKTIIEWARTAGCDQILTIVGAPSESDEQIKEPTIQGVGSTPNARKKLQDAGVQLLEVGIIPGIPGVLLNEGRYAFFDVIALLTTVTPEIPSFRSAARIIELLDKIALPGFKIDVEPLYRQAEIIENRLNALRRQVPTVQTREGQGVYT